MSIFSTIKRVFSKEKKAKPTVQYSKPAGPTRPTPSKSFNTKKFLESGGTKVAKTPSEARVVFSRTKIGTAIRRSGGGGGGSSSYSPTPTGHKKVVTPTVQTEEIKEDIKPDVVKQTKTIQPAPKRIEPVSEEDKYSKRYAKLSYWQATRATGKNVFDVFLHKKGNHFKDILNPYDYTATPKYAQTAYIEPKFGTVAPGETPYKEVTYGDLQKDIDLKNYLKRQPIISETQKEVSEYHQELQQGVYEGKWDVKQAQKKEKKFVEKKNIELNKKISEATTSGIPGIGERTSPVREYVKIAAMSTPLTSSVLLARETQEAPLVVTESGAINYKPTVGMAMAGIGVLPVGQFAKLKTMEKSLAMETVKGLEKQPIKYGSKIIKTDNSGLVFLKGTREFHGLKQEVKMAGRLAKDERGKMFLPEGVAESHTIGKLDYNILGGKKSTQFISSTRQEFGSKSVSIPISDKTKSFVTFSKTVTLPEVSSSTIYQYPSKINKAEKVGEDIVKQFIKNKKIGNTIRIDMDVSFGTKIDQETFFSFTPTQDGKIKSFGITKVKELPEKKILKTSKQTEPSLEKSFKEFSKNERFNIKESKVESKIIEKQSTPKTIQQSKIENLPLNVKEKVESVYTPKTFMKPKIKPSIVSATKLGIRSATKTKSYAIQKPSLSSMNLIQSKQISGQIQSPLAVTTSKSIATQKLATKTTPSFHTPTTPTSIGAPSIRSSGFLGAMLPKPNLNLGISKGGRNLGVSRVFQYTPSYKAWVFGIKGKKTKGIIMNGREVFTGFETRKIISKTKKRRKKKK